MFRGSKIQDISFQRMFRFFSLTICLCSALCRESAKFDENWYENVPFPIKHQTE